MKALICLLLLSLIIAFPTRAQEVTPDDIPEPMPMVDEGEYDIVNFLLLGSDTANSNNAGRTDVLLILSVNRTAGTVSMLSLPRDLYVYIPGYRVYRINAAYGYGENNGYPGGGAQLLIDTIRYNLGLEIDHYARVDFNGFKQVIDDLGGVELSVDCAIQDWRLKEPTLDPQVEENWEMFTLPVGVHEMDGELALWYARSRRTSSDFDRGRRHQALIRALWHRIRGLNLLEQATDVWPQALEMVDTDITLEEMLSFVPLTASLDTSRIASYVFRPHVEVRSWLSPEGSSVQVPQRDAIAELERRMMQPPTENQLGREHARIEVVNASGIRSLGQVAAERLAWEGFVPQLSQETAPYRDYTVIYDYTGQSKGSSLGVLQQVLRVSPEGVIVEPNPNRQVDFRVVIGGSYYSCTHNVTPPEAPPATDDGTVDG
jgi:polyisoprenyl-teichoic acid--peptidoglycan teichoic acid transferase